jgi:GR25 family glycosyltransferase involved in LPS biosynthesis
MGDFLMIYKDYYDIFLYYIKTKLYINKKSIKTVIINLDERKDRLDSIVNQLNNNNISNYERFSAIKIDKNLDNNKTLDNNKNFKIINKYKCWKKMDMEYVRLASGCKMSHLEVLKKYRNCSDEYILIVEDDAILGHNIESPFNEIIMKGNVEMYLNMALEQLKDKTWDILYLTCNLKKKEDAIKVSPNLLYINKGLTTTAQLFKVSDIDKIIKIIEESDIEIDNTYNSYLKNKYCVYPMCAYQMESYSDINKKITDYGNFHKNFKYD